VPAPRPSSPLLHCLCGTGCPDCYGTLRCGCPDCVPPDCSCRHCRARRGPGKLCRATRHQVRWERLGKLPPLEYQVAVLVRPSFGTEEQCSVEEKPSVLSCSEVKRRPQSCLFPHSHRLASQRTWSGEWDRPAPRVRPPRSPAPLRRTEPAKQTKYFCRQCRVDVCNVCLTRTACAGHNVQFLGQATFACQSAAHVIDHEHLAQPH